ncbi:nuclear transport factor 2 family protein [Yoonia sp. BS5-3]|uniref:Nuclear transport factor 2 family protein n=1 Tax=Yoonia phaeophyticola TaxID=3137369 RepID=A0ABZ2V8I8_9RHOB
MNQMPLQISNFFLAMQAGPAGFERLGALFAPDATYAEPFSAQSTPHQGREAIMAAFQASRTDAFDDALISLGAVSVQDTQITVKWTCISQAIPGGQGSGTNVFEMQDGLIKSLVTTLDMP